MGPTVSRVGHVTSPTFSWKRHRKRDKKPSEFTIDGSYIRVHHKNQPLHGKIGYCPLVMYRFLLFFRVVSGDYGKPCFCWPVGKTIQSLDRNQLYRLFTEFLIAPSLLAELLGGEEVFDGDFFQQGKWGWGVEGCRVEKGREDIYEMDIRMRCIQDGKHQI